MLFRIVLGVVILLGSLASRLQAEGLELRKWKVDGVEREALLATPKGVRKAGAEQKHPLVFVFHGHGGSGRHAARVMPIHTLWPDALCVYPQGLNTPGKLTDPEGKKPGWQQAAGGQNDRDLKFFDAMLEKLKTEFAVDSARIFSTGHSNGGGFTYLLWSERPDVFAAVAPSASAAAGRMAGAMKPKPVLHLAGRNDALVKFNWQERTIQELIKLNQCEDKGFSWKSMTVYPSPNNTPVVTYIHDGAHGYPDAGAKLTVEFFREYSTIPTQSPPPSASKSP